MKNVKNKSLAAKKNPNQTSRKKILPFYRTTDLYLASFLRCQGVILEGIEREKKRAIFVFQNNGNIQELMNGYFNNSNVEVLSYKVALADLRSIIFNYKNSEVMKED